VQQALGAMFLSRFQGPFHADPRLAPSRAVAMCQYAQWVSPLNPQVDLYTRAAAPPHTRLCLPFARLKNGLPLTHILLSGITEGLYPRRLPAPSTSPAPTGRSAACCCGSQPHPVAPRSSAGGG
jgi:hypothetical protein